MNRAQSALLFSSILLLAAWGCGDDPTSVPEQRFSARSDSTFAVGAISLLEVGNYAGNISVTPGDPGEVVVQVEKWAGRPEDLDEIVVELVELPNGVRITTTNPSDLDQVSVDLGITVPADSRPVIQCGAGNVEYTGRADGVSSFGIGAGSITLKLPPDVNVAVDLSVAAGTIHVGFPVSGFVSEHNVEGIIGTGADGSVVAGVGAGTISVVPQQM